MANRCTRIPEIMMPREGTDLSKWAVIACDQYTSQPEYWAETDRIVGDAPSTLRLTLPEVYLEDADVASHIERIHKTMQQYVQDGTLRTLPAGAVLTERWSGGSAPRRGIVLAVDLEAYEYTPGSASLIRPTEKTVVERIPPRLKVREGACLELPHIMILIDDPDRRIIEPLFEKTGSFSKLYDTDLMQNGGHITGWFIPQGKDTDAIESGLEALCDRETFNAKYGCTDAQALLPYAVGDGNHSMATAKAYWEEVKKGLTPEEQENHPARFALAEIVNIHDESIIIEPIHRALFGIDGEELLKSLTAFYEAQGCKAYVADNAPETEGAHFYPFVSAEKNGVFVVENPKWAIPVATIQTGLDAFLAEHKDVKIDFIHGADVVVSLAEKKGNFGFILPDIAKNDLFRGVVFDGVLPRKTFSMGEAHEKRYYLEAQASVKYKSVHFRGRSRFGCAFCFPVEHRSPLLRAAQHEGRREGERLVRRKRTGQADPVLRPHRADRARLDERIKHCVPGTRRLDARRLGARRTFLRLDTRRLLLPLGQVHAQRFFPCPSGLPQCFGRQTPCKAQPAALRLGQTDIERRGSLCFRVNAQDARRAELAVEHGAHAAGLLPPVERACPPPFKIHRRPHTHPPIRKTRPSYYKVRGLVFC